MSSDSGSLKLLRVLYVEDEENVRKELVDFLRRRVRELFQASNGREGLEKFIEHKPDIVLTDINMPVMDGLEMARLIRAEAPDTPIIITTAYNEPDFLLRSIDIGVDKYVIKPIDTKLLLNNILRSAQALFKQRKLEAQSILMRHILDGLSVYHSSKTPELLETEFMVFLGYGERERFREEQCSHADFFTKLDGALYPAQNNEEWANYLVENPDVRHIIRVHGNKGGRYLALYTPLPEVGKYICNFVPLNSV